MVWKIELHFTRSLSSIIHMFLLSDFRLISNDVLEFLNHFEVGRLTPGVGGDFSPMLDIRVGCSSFSAHIDSHLPSILCRETRRGARFRISGALHRRPLLVASVLLFSDCRSSSLHVPLVPVAAVATYSYLSICLLDRCWRFCRAQVLPQQAQVHGLDCPLSRFSGPNPPLWSMILFMAEWCYTTN